MPSWSRSPTRSWPTVSSGSPGARSPSCAGRSARSGSTSPRSRSASTPRSTRRRWPRSGPARRVATELVPGVTLDEVLATFRAIAAAQERFGRERVAPVRRQLHGVGVGRRPTSSSSPVMPSKGPATTHRASTSSRSSNSSEALTRRRRDPRRAARRPRLPRRAGGARRPPGGDAGLLRFEQGIRVPGRRLDAPSGAVVAGRGGPLARRRADAVPRSRRGARARRRDRPTAPSSARRRARSTGGSG